MAGKGVYCREEKLGYLHSLLCLSLCPSLSLSLSLSLCLSLTHRHSVSELPEEMKSLIIEKSKMGLDEDPELLVKGGFQPLFISYFIIPPSLTLGVCLLRSVRVHYDSVRLCLF